MLISAQNECENNIINLENVSSVAEKNNEIKPIKKESVANKSGASKNSKGKK